MQVKGVVTVPTDLSITSPSCRPDDAQAGTCLPGAYAFRYQAFDNQGRVSTTPLRTARIHTLHIHTLHYELTSSTDVF